MRSCLLLSTYIHEQYTGNNATEIVKALDELFTPCNDNGWASSGVYCFWAPESFEILYVGLALDLAQRFRQHNGMIKSPRNTCKHYKIKDWFKSHDKLGYSVLVQSSLSQASCKRFNIRFDLPKDEMERQHGELIMAGHEAIVSTEGLLIEAHKKAKGILPRWNNVGGSISGGKKATARHIYLLKLFSGELDDWMISRKSIMQLFQNPTYEKWENYLHAIRSHAIITQSSFNEAWLHFPDIGKIKSEILGNNYLPVKWTS
jgi:hypothetical protein